ncbi:MAG: hypothetical protein JW939_04835 [Candidatus Thermoplasmatota archaeon]|nr:hypothetical protein [Candidatus Thermoplasmatota archaeon]
MIEFCFLLVLFSPLLYYAVAIVVYFKKKESRAFMQMVVFPLPFVFLIGFLLYNGYENPEHFRELSYVLMAVSIFTGLGIITHQLIDRERELLSLLTRMPASFLLLATPITMLVPGLFLKVAPFSYVVIGALMGIFGYIRYYQGKKRGLLYAYSAILFFVAAPLVSLVISYIYFDMIKENVIYRRAYWGDVTCHDIGYPVIFFQEEFIKPFLFSSGYLGLMAIVSSVRKYLLREKMKKDGTIPKEFFEVIEEKFHEEQN